MQSNRSQRSRSASPLPSIDVAAPWLVDVRERQTETDDKTWRKKNLDRGRSRKKGEEDGERDEEETVRRAGSHTRIRVDHREQSTRGQSKDLHRGNRTEIIGRVSFRGGEADRVTQSQQRVNVRVSWLPRFDESEQTRARCPVHHATWPIAAEQQHFSGSVCRTRSDDLARNLFGYLLD